MIQKKVCMLGGFAVGKTSLVARFVTSISRTRYLTTVGVKIEKKSVQVANQQLDLVLWDIYGDDEFQRVRMSYLRGASGYLLVVDPTRKATLETGDCLARQRREDHRPCAVHPGPEQGRPHRPVGNRRTCARRLEVDDHPDEREDGHRRRGGIPRSGARHGQRGELTCPTMPPLRRFCRLWRSWCSSAAPTVLSCHSCRYPSGSACSAGIRHSRFSGPSSRMPGSTASSPSGRLRSGLCHETDEYGTATTTSRSRQSFSVAEIC